VSQQALLHVRDLLEDSPSSDGPPPPFGKRVEVLDVALERPERGQPPRRAGVLGTDAGRALLVVPEPGSNISASSGRALAQ